MTLSGQSRLFTFIVILLLVVVVLVDVYSKNTLEQQHEYSNKLSKLSQGVFELNLLTTEHILNRSKRSNAQWRTRHASLTNQILIAMRSFESESNNLLFRARLDLARMRSLFFKLLVAEKKNESTIDNKKAKIIINKLIVQIQLLSQTAISNINRAGVISRADLEDSEAKANTTFLLTMLVISIVVILLLFWIQKFLISPIVKLNEHSDLLIQGHYEHKINVVGESEIAKLSSSFNTLSSTISEKISDLTSNSKQLKESKLRLESALRLTKLTEMQYKDIFYAAADAIVTINQSGLIQTVNPACVKLFGYEKAELVDKNISLLVGAEDKDKHDDYIQNYVTTRIPKVVDIGRNVYGQHKNGSVVPVHLRISEIKKEHGIEFIGILRDIAEEIKSEQIISKNRELLESTNKELESYAYSISHDLRSPLRSIDGFSLVLQEDYGDQLDDDAKDYLNRIRAGTKKMSGLITELLKMSRITKEGINFKKVDLVSLANEEISQLREQYPNNTIEFVCPKQLLTIGDVALLSSVIENLLGNAAKYSSNENPIIIELGSTVIECDNVFYIKDNGAGFDMKHKNKLFKAFQRLHKVNQFEGSGIGLATVQRIITRHEGKIWAEAEINKGATFYFTLNVTDSGSRSAVINERGLS